jgi:hypothetical protein
MPAGNPKQPQLSTSSHGNKDPEVAELNFAGWWKDGVEGRCVCRIPAKQDVEGIVKGLKMFHLSKSPHAAFDTVIIVT